MGGSQPYLNLLLPPMSKQIEDIIYMDLEEDDGAERYCISDHIDH